jgi:hypothetical protein
MKIKISTTAIIIILSTILVGCIAYSVFYNNTPSVVFLNKNELASFLIKDKDNYYKSFNEKDFIVRNVSSIDEYREKIRNGTSNFSLSQKGKVIFCVEKLNKMLVNVKYPWFDGKKAIKSPWKFGSIDGSNYENGLPHTRNDVIILPQVTLDNYPQQELTKLILHEKIHIYQKMYPSDIENYIQHNKYYKFKKRMEIIDSRANPDLDEWTYNDSTNKTFVAIYNPNPTNISDVQFYPDNNNSEEHPYEKMAYEMSETITKQLY